MTTRFDTSFKETILKSDLPAIIETAGEIGIDTILDEGLLKDIPVLRTLHALGKTFGNIKNYLFAKKMMKFLECISSLPEKDRQLLISKLESDEVFGKYAGERIIELLSRVESEKKPTLVAAALTLYAQGLISGLQLNRIHYAIERFLLCDIDQLRSFCTENPEPWSTDGNAVTANFVNSGLAYVRSGFGVGGVLPTETAEIFLQVCDKAEI